MEKHKITVAIPVYKVELYLVECLTTVCRQTYRNLEILVIDDASTDKCGFIADRFAEMDPRVRVIHKPVNEGLAAGRNTTIEEMTGDYIYWVDGDDYLEDDAVEKAVQVMEETGADIVKTLIRKREAPYAGVYTPEEYMHILLPDTIQSNVIGCLIKRNLYQGVFHTPGRILEDYESMPQLAEKAHKIAVIAKGPYGYREMRPGGITATGFHNFQGYHPRTLVTAERYNRYHETYPEECKRVLRSFVDYSCMACLYARDGDNLLDIRKNMTFLERAVMLEPSVSRYKKWLYRAIISNSAKVGIARKLHKWKGRLDSRKQLLART